MKSPGRLILLLLLLLPAVAAAYSTFGQNKVAYRDLDWSVLAAEHFDVHFYPEERELAELAAELAETYYGELALRLGCVVPWRIPVFVYADSKSFRQTRIYPGHLPESVGGFTEYLKGRVVVPNSGDLAAFAHTLKHELVHVFVYAILRTEVGGRGVASFARPSLWFEEGLAEYLSEGVTVEAEIYLRDLVLEEKVVPLTELEYYGPVFLLYKEGQSAAAYIAETYGEEALGALVRNAYTGERFSLVVRDVLGLELSRLDEDWRNWLKRRYYPEITERVPLSAAGERRTGREEMALAPAYAERNGVPGFVYLSDYLGYQGLFWAPLEGEPDYATLLVAGRNPDFESLRMFATSLDAEAGRVVFVAERRGRDLLFVYDLAEKGVSASYAVGDTVALSHPSWGGGRVVCAGLDEGGASDLYLLDTVDGSAVRLTQDFAHEAEPVFTPDGGAVVYASNEDTGHLSADRNLYRLELATGERSRLTEGPWRDSSPFFDAEGRLHFTSDRGGAADLYRLEGDGRTTRLTRLFTGAWHASFTPDGRVLCQGLQRHGFGVFLINELEALPEDGEPTEAAPPPELPRLAARGDWGEVQPYKTEFTLDVVRSEVAYDPEFGTGFGTALGLTDLTGDQRIVFQLYSVGEGFDSFFEYLNVAATYVNQSRRLGWGVGAFHYVDDYLDLTTLVPYFERRYGVLGLVNYPFSRYTRLEASAVVRGSERYDYLDETWTVRPLGSAYLGFVFDNTLWDLIGPVDGARVNLSAGQTFDLSTGEAAYHSLWADLRYYLRTSRRTTLAARAVGRYTGGPDARRSYFGGSLSMRGYPYGYFNGTRLFMGNLEWRFPLFDYLALGLPAGNLVFSHLEGALFFDVGTAWDVGEEPSGLEGSFGLGIRVGLGPFVALRFDFSWLTDFAEVQREGVFGFYIGWNY